MRYSHLRPIILFNVLFLFLSIQISGQEHDHHNHGAEHDHGHHDHHSHHKHELGLANSLVYFTKEKEFSYGLHLHYSHQIPVDRLRLGLGYERVFDDLGHNTFGVIFLYDALDNTFINLSPGIAFEDEHPGEIEPALHLEVSYEFPLGNLHIGPSVELAWEPEDIHISAGLHIGLGF